MGKTSTAAIGTRFTRATGRERSVETVTDVLTTTNSKGEVVSVRYVATHEFCGQTVTDYDVPQATLARAEIVEDPTPRPVKPPQVSISRSFKAGVRSGPAFDDALTAWLEKAQAIVDAAYTHPANPAPVLSASIGRRYARIVSSDGGSSRYAYAFINLSNGDVLKPAGWKGPAKHARGNIFTDKLGVTAYGAVYLR